MLANPLLNQPDEHVSRAILRQEELAHAFRELMTTGQSFQSSNSYREKFYEEVISLAEKVNFHGLH
jgi:hypothetical protein